MIWIEFVISAAVIVWAGIRLTVCADKLSEHFQIGHMWVGVILLGLITSLPEAITSISAVVNFRANDLAVGNILGSNNFNPLLIVVMDAAYRKGSITNAIHLRKSHLWSGFCACFLTVIVIVELFASQRIDLMHWGSLSMGVSFIALFYFLGMKKIAQLESVETLEDSQPISGDDTFSTFSMVSNLVFNTILIVGGAIWLSKSSNSLALSTGLGQTFFGSIFLAFVTSLPEMVVTLSALKLGSFDLAIGNIFGSNMTNLFILFLCSLVYRGGEAFLSSVSSTHMWTAGLSIVLTVCVLKGIQSKNKKTFGNMGLDSLLIAFLFLIGMAILYQLK